MPFGRNFNPEWGYAAPSPSVLRTARLVGIAAIIGASAGAATVFSLLDRPIAQESVAARTLVAPDSKRPVTTSTSVAAQQPTEPQQVKSSAEAQNSAEQTARPGATVHPQPSELATTATRQRPTSAAALAETPSVKPPSAPINDTMAAAPDPAPAPKPQSKKPRILLRTARHTTAPRYDARDYEGYFGGPRNGYEPRYGYEPR
jgi:hypothetical protein